MDNTLVIRNVSGSTNPPAGNGGVGGRAEAVVPLAMRLAMDAQPSAQTG